MSPDRSPAHCSPPQTHSSYVDLPSSSPNPPSNSLPVESQPSEPQDGAQATRMQSVFHRLLFSSNRGHHPNNTRERWDEMCFVTLKQTNERRRKNLEPKVQLICFAKRPPGDDSQNDHLHLILSHDFEETARHIEGMNQNMMETQTSDSTLSTTVQIDLTQSIGSRALATKEYMATLFRPQMELARKYAESWSNGSQAKLIRTYIVVVGSGAPIQLAKRCWRRWEEWSSHSRK
ncbi:hypothetical protein SpCBS45565_g02834 [Spizellomyces sp. 'palustris']|nr:hypothetical protein SpCBS45565_g02834 [Spizellomyces sp. 'palustris']